MPRKFDMEKFVDALRSITTESPVSREDLTRAANTLGMKYAPAAIVKDENRHTGERGMFLVPELDNDLVVVDDSDDDSDTVAASPVRSTAALIAKSGQTVPDHESLIPHKIGDYVPFGNFRPVQQIIRSQLFFPVFVTGLSGNGKTTMIDQVCARLKRELFRVSITIQTDEDDLLGGFRLVNGETVWQDGPVIQAMKRGGVLLLDEVDLASHKIMCLQPVLEGKGIYLKKIGERIDPAPGFTVLATANTKGLGNDDGQFVGTNVLNEAFLDRFPVTLEQDYPAASTEVKIITKRMTTLGKVNEHFAKTLVSWASTIRKAYREGASEYIVTTRRLLNIAEAYSIFDDKKKAISMSITRFPQETQDAWISAYDKLDDGMDDTDGKANGGFIPPKGSMASTAAKFKGTRITNREDLQSGNSYIIAVDYENRDIAKTAGARFDGDFWMIAGPLVPDELIEGGYIVADHR